jgi:hypothetical protein
MTPTQLPLADEPTAVREAVEGAVAFDRTPPDWTWQMTRDEATKKTPAPTFARHGMARFAEKFGVEPDVIWCSPLNVEQLTGFPGVRVWNGGGIHSPDLFAFGRVGLPPQPVGKRL